MKPLCDLCGSRHESYQGHVFATNRDATNTSATNAVSLDERKGSAQKASPAFDQGVAHVGAEAVSGKTRNRRSREAYNAYQREYMRKRRGRDLA
jgi:hypothetical protein